MLRPGNPIRPRAGRTANTVGRRRHGQPRPEVEGAPRRPTAAERARTLIEGNSSAVVAIPGLESAEPYAMVPSRWAADARGDLLLTLPAGSPAARAARYAQDDELTAVLELTDVAPVAVADRIRARVRIAGWLTPAGRRALPGRLRLEVGDVWLEDRWGTRRVEPDDFAAAAPDPLAAREAELLQHLAAAHSTQLAELVVLVDGRPGAGRVHAVPLALNRFELRVRFGGAGTAFDASFAFPVPVTGIGELREAMHALFRAARRCAAPEDGEADRD